MKLNFHIYMKKNMFTGRVHTNQYGDLEFAKCYYILKDKINAKKN